jgi:DNA (cytosine-5)-methyltransferase 1
MNSVELFTGAGGLAMGMSRAGFDHLAVIERDADSCRTIRANQTRNVEPVCHWPLFQRDVCAFDYREIEGPVDLVAGGPPCQPFSLGGKHQGNQDSRDMFPQAVRAVRELRPRAFVFENVKGLLRQSFAPYFQYTLLKLQYPEVLERAGESWEEHSRRLQRIHTRGDATGLTYRLLFSLVNAADYGVPQRRERVIIVGFRSDIQQRWNFPPATHTKDALLRDMHATGDYWERHGVARRHRPAAPKQLQSRIELLQAEVPAWLGRPWKTVRDAIADLPDPETRAAAGISDHKFIGGARSYHGHTGSPLDEPAKTLKAGDHGVPGGENMLLKPDGSVRYFTVRESARLQTFPEDYRFPGSWTESMRQLGNAVPVTLAQVIGASVAGCLAQADGNN